ncbi:MAG: PAS domain S-box protein [Deltaproteobacteria bacterium]|nr:PAS domain S-box protein [Deltaproteobacteria bacterium]
MGNPINILHLEDDATDAELIQAMLDAADMSCRTTVVQTRDQFSEALRKGGHDVILADYRLPSYDGLSALRLAGEVCPDVPFIFVSGTMGEDPAIEALTEGATDYVLKQKLSRLVPALKRALREAENRRERARVQKILRESEERFRTLAEKSLVGVYIIQDGLFRYVNQALAEIFGYAIEEIMDRLGPGDLLTPEDRERVLDSIRRRTIGEIESDHFEFHMRRKEGALRTLEAFGSRALHQGRPAVLGTVIDITERKASEARVLQATKRWAQTFDAVPDLIAILDNDFRIVQVNKAMADRLGLTPEECAGQFCYNAVHGRDAPPPFCPNVRSLRDGKEHMVEVSEKRLGGDFIVSTSPMFDSQGRMIGSVHVSRDITERKKAEVALHTSQLQLTEAMDLAHIVYWEIDPATESFVFNDPFYAFCGTTAAHEGGYRMAMDEYVRRFIHPEDVGAFHEMIGRNRVGRDPETFLVFENRVIRRDGDVRHALARIRVIRDTAGSIVRVYGALQDITERKLAEKELDRVSRRNRLLLESAGEGIFGLDSEGKVTFINPVAAAWLGYDPEELLGRRSHQLIHFQKANGTPYLEEYCPICMAYRDGTIHRSTKDLFWKKDGTTFPVEYTSTPIFEGTKPSGAVVTFRDITEREKMEERLQQAQKMEALGTLAGGIAHDFNNILTPIIVHTEMALDDIPKKSRQRFSLEQVLKAGERARELVQQILAFSRQKESKRVLLKIGPIVKEVLKLLRASLPSTIEIRKDITTEPWSISADPTQIHQILMNLCTNAAHAMREKGGVLEVGFANESLDSASAASIPGSHPGCYLTLRVVDTGNGMSPEVMEHVFEPYFTTKEKGEGTGLGLAVVHGIVASLGGTVSVESEPGKGSAFHVYLPAVEREAPSSIQSGVSLPGGTERILLVDDEKAMVDAMKPMLEHLGYRVTARTSSVEALELFQSDPSRFDLLLTDQTMPNLTGTDLAIEVQKIKPGIPILLCSGFSDLVNEEEAKAMGIGGYVMKPIVRKEIAGAIRRVIDNP